mmetsp:Transcript_37378/g.27582  ORF Transcript_37378/g.27582 Transcript_37378/m.27582 type:complete len:103 (+) Transcript_37378:450-758(+)
MDLHNEQKCKRPRVRCKYCDRQFYKIERELHQRTCPKLEVQCEVCGEQKKKEEMDSHECFTPDGKLLHQIVVQQPNLEMACAKLEKTLKTIEEKHEAVQATL